MRSRQDVRLPAQRTIGTEHDDRHVPRLEAGMSKILLGGDFIRESWSTEWLSGAKW